MDLSTNESEIQNSTYIMLQERISRQAPNVIASAVSAVQILKILIGNKADCFLMIRYASSLLADNPKGNQDGPLRIQKIAQMLQKAYKRNQYNQENENIFSHRYRDEDEEGPSLNFFFVIVEYLWAMRTFFNCHIIEFRDLIANTVLRMQKSEDKQFQFADRYYDLKKIDIDLVAKSFILSIRRLLYWQYPQSLYLVKKYLSDSFAKNYLKKLRLAHCLVQRDWTVQANEIIKLFLHSIQVISCQGMSEARLFEHFEYHLADSFERYLWDFTPYNAVVQRVRLSHAFFLTNKKKQSKSKQTLKTKQKSQSRLRSESVNVPAKKSDSKKFEAKKKK